MFYHRQQDHLVSVCHAEFYISHQLWTKRHNMEVLKSKYLKIVPKCTSGIWDLMWRHHSVCHLEKVSACRQDRSENTKCVTRLLGPDWEQQSGLMSITCLAQGPYINTEPSPGLRSKVIRTHIVSLPSCDGDQEAATLLTSVSICELLQYYCLGDAAVVSGKLPCQEEVCVWGYQLT